MQDTQGLGETPSLEREWLVRDYCLDAVLDDQVAMTTHHTWIFTDNIVSVVERHTNML